MKKINLIILTFVLLTATAISSSAQTKIATVDMKKLFNGYWKKKSAEAALDTRKAELRREIKEQGDGLEKAQTDYKKLLEQASDPAISADERDKRKQAAASKAKEINTTKVALEQYQRTAETSLGEQSQRMSANIVAEIQKAVADKAKAGGYTLILDASGASTSGTPLVVFTDGSTDISDSVLAQINAGAPIDVTKPSGLPLNISTNLP